MWIWKRRIWSNLLKKSLMQNFIFFVQWNLLLMSSGKHKSCWHIEEHLFTKPKNSLAVNFETFSSNSLAFLRFIPWCLFKPCEEHILYYKFHYSTFLFLLFILHPLQNLICDQNLCHLLKILPRAIHVRLLNRFQPSNHCLVVASYWKYLCRFSGPAFKIQVFGSEQ